VDSGDDVDVIEIDGASHNSVEDIRELRGNAAYRPARARYKVYYIDEVHMLSAAAFNALLKVLEEPPSHVKFIFSTTEPHKVPPTIQSRCQRFDFRNLTPAAILERLKSIAEAEGIKVEEGALEQIARFAAGSMRDAESLLDQVVAACGESVSSDSVSEVLGTIPVDALSAIFTALVEGNTAAALEGVDGVLSAGRAERQLVSEFIDYLRDILVAAECGEDSRLIVRGPHEREVIGGDCRKWEAEALIYAMQLLSETYARLARFPQSRGLLDVAIVKLSRAEDFLRLQSFLSDLRSGRNSLLPRKEASPSLPFAGETGPGPEGVSEIERLKVALVKEARKWGKLAARGLETLASWHIEDDTVRVSLPADRKIELHQLESSEARDALSRAASGALGHEVSVIIKAEGNSTDAANGRPRRARRGLVEQALAEPAVRRVLETFGGSIQNVEEH
jgi:DNA polymerase-3 subunit gamma/tau